MLQHRSGHGQFRGFLDLEDAFFLDRNQTSADLAKLQIRPHASGDIFAGWVGFFGYEWLCQHHGYTCRAARDIANIPDGLFARPQTVFYIEGDDLLLQSALPGRAVYWAKIISESQPPPRPAANDEAATNPQTNCDFATYAGLFDAAKEAIRDGETYQIKLSIRHTAKAPDAAAAFERLMRSNPSPEAFYLHWDNFALISCSPETVIDLRGDQLATRPIGGTFPRVAECPDPSPEALRLAFEQNSKETSEHNMLIDLERNDLNRVCLPGSVQITHLRQVETYAHVHHLVTEIAGRIPPDASRADILRALLPGGSITGCPKRRTVELIDGWEPSFRGPYTGSFGTLEDNGDMHLNLIIRTLMIHGNRAYVQAGGGIVVDSDPAYEYRENLLKGQALIELLSEKQGF